MSRDITAGVSSAISDTQVRPALLWYGEFTSGNAYLWTGLGNLSWNSITWSGAGTLLGISNIEESSEIKASGINVTLSGVPSSLISLALGDVRQGYECAVYMAFFDTNNAIISDPVLVFEGGSIRPQSSRMARLLLFQSPMNLGSSIYRGRGRFATRTRSNKGYLQAMLVCNMWQVSKTRRSHGARVRMAMHKANHLPPTTTMRA